MLSGILDNFFFVKFTEYISNLIINVQPIFGFHLSKHDIGSRNLIDCELY